MASWKSLPLSPSLRNSRRERYFRLTSGKGEEEASMAQKRGKLDSVLACELGPRKGERVDFFSKLEEMPKGQSEPMPFGEMMAQAGIVLNAGSDTTASGLTNTLWLLAKYPHTFAKLRQELDGLMTEGTISPDFNMLMASPYLRACIDESLRLRPPVAIGLPRVAPKEGSTICVDISFQVV
jgi:cytochrome P450